MTGLEYLRRANDLAEKGLTLTLHAYQSHVFMEWRELRPTAEYPWDRLCDQLNGRGVGNLGEALIDLELQPVHEALRALLDHDVIRQMADLAEFQNGAIVADKKTARERREFAELAWTRAEAFVDKAQAAVRLRTRGEKGAAGGPRRRDCWRRGSVSACGC